MSKFRPSGRVLTFDGAISASNSASAGDVVQDSLITDLILKMLRAMTGPDWLLREELWLMYTCTCSGNQSLWREEQWRMPQIKTCNLSRWMIC